jgi:hypothetical protein
MMKFFKIFNKNLLVLPRCNAIKKEFSKFTLIKNADNEKQYEKKNENKFISTEPNMKNIIAAKQKFVKKKVDLKTRIKTKMMEVNLPFSERAQVKIQKFIEDRNDLFINYEKSNEFPVLVSLIVGLWDALEEVKETSNKDVNKIQSIFVVENEQQVENILKIANQVGGMTFLSYNKTTPKEILNISQFLIIKSDELQQFLANNFNSIAGNFFLLLMDINNKDAIKSLKLLNKPLVERLSKSVIVNVSNNFKNSTQIEKELSFLRKRFFKFSITEEENIAFNNISTEYSGMYIEEKEKMLEVIENLIEKFKGKTIAIFTQPNYLKKDFSERNGIKINPEKGIFEVVIELPFESIDEFNRRQESLDNSSINKQSYMISLINPKSSREIEELQKTTNIKFKIQNLISKIQNINNESVPLESSESESNLNSDKTNKEEQSFFKNIQNMVQKSKVHVEKNEIIESYYQKLKSNPFLQKTIFSLFLNSNFDQFFTNNDVENISLLNSKKGFRTVQISPLNSKQFEERFYIVKFLLSNKICGLKELDHKVFRVYESFDYICDIPVERLNEIIKNGEEMGLDIKVVKILPIIYHNVYKDLYYKGGTQN